jgi:hypothetical protein
VNTGIKWTTPALVWLVSCPLSSSFAFSLARSNPQNHLLCQSMLSSSWTADDSQQAVEAPADGHAGTKAAGTHVFQGQGTLTGPNTIEVNGQTLTFKVYVLATGGQPSLPPIPGLSDAPSIWKLCHPAWSSWEGASWPWKWHRAFPCWDPK